MVAVLFCLWASGACMTLPDDKEQTIKASDKGTLESETLTSFQQAALDAIHYSVNFVNTAKKGYNKVQDGFKVSHDDLAKVVVGLSQVRMNSTSIVADLKSSHLQVLGAFDDASLELFGAEDKVNGYLKEAQYLSEELALDLERDYLPEVAFTVGNLMKTPLDYIVKIKEAYTNASSATQTISKSLDLATEMLQNKKQEMRAKVEEARSKLFQDVVLPIGASVMTAVGEIDKALKEVDEKDDDFRANNGSISAIRKSINAVFGVLESGIDSIDSYNSLNDFAEDADKAEELLSNMDRISNNARKVHDLLNNQLKSINNQEKAIDANVKVETPKIEKIDAEYEQVSDADMKVFAKWITDKFAAKISKQLKKSAIKVKKPNLSKI